MSKLVLKLASAVVLAVTFVGPPAIGNPAPATDITAVKTDPAQAAAPSDVPSPPDTTRASDIATGLRDAHELLSNGNAVGAVARWYDVLQLDPKNVEARENADHVQIEQARRMLSILSGVRNLSDMADAFDNRSCEQNALRFVPFLRDTVQSIDGANRYVDPALYDDFELFVESNGLAGIVAVPGGVVAPHARRPAGRELLRRLTRWIDRLHRDKLIIKVKAPPGLSPPDYNLRQWKFQVVSQGVVNIDGPPVLSMAPLKAIVEDGVWRIAPREGFSLTYDLTSVYNVSRKTR